MSGIKVVDMNEASGQEAEQNEGATEETQPPEQEMEPIEEEPPNISNEITQEETEDINQEEAKPKKKDKALDKKVQCKKCDKEMTLKTYRYIHEKKCNGKLEEKPVKPQAKPKPKAMPTPRIATKPEGFSSLRTKPVATKAPPPEPVIQQQRSPVYDIREHYQILQNEYIKHKQEKYSNLCQNMFNSKAKKR